jgi:hypothetical protein
MIDASELPFEENLEMSKKVREIAEKYGVGMEAELGQIMGVEDDMVVAEDDSVLTDPEDAKRFCDALDLSAFACAVGTAHGFYKGDPRSISTASSDQRAHPHADGAARRHRPVGRDLRQGDRPRQRQDQHLDQPQARLRQSFVDYHRPSPRTSSRCG